MPRLRIPPVLALVLACLLASPAIAQQPTALPAPVVREGATVQISPHVHVIPDGLVPMVPNVGFVIGTRAVLVIDPGMGRRSGEAVLRELRKLTASDDIYIVNTHFHPEHTTGDIAFPSSAKIIRALAQQQDVDELGMRWVEMFSRMRPALAELLQGASFRAPTETFERAMTLDLGGVHVRLVRLGPGHTRGDTVFHVEEDGVLFSGDLAMRDLFPAFATQQSSARSWIASLNELDTFGARRVVPAHGVMTDASVIGAYRDYLVALQQRVAELKRAGKSAEEVAAQVQEEFPSRLPGWTGAGRPRAAAMAIYRETP